MHFHSYTASYLINKKMGIGASKNKITSQDKAILDLKVQRDKLKRYQKNVRNYNQVCNYERETQ